MRIEWVARGSCAAIALLALLGAAPTTQPRTTTTQLTHPTTASSATRPSISLAPTTQERRDQMHSWFAALSNPDPRERDEARQSLLTLERDDLPALHALVEASRPVSPSQAAALHDIVVHVYLSGEDYLKSEKGFLGVKPADAMATVEGEENEQRAHPLRGTIVLDRVPGFVGFRSFQNGDIIIAIKERPETTLEKASDFTDIIKEQTAGTVLHMEIMRQMRKMVLIIKLDARPPGDALEVDEAINVMEKAGEAYWDREFAPLVSGGVS
jgi:hypothetical protein